MKDAELFELQTEIARQIVSAVAPELIEAEANLARKRRPSEFTIWDNLCRGTWHLSRDGQDDVRLAHEYFDQCIAADPEFGLGWNGKVCAQQKMLYEQRTDSPEQTVASLIENARTCLRLEPKADYSHTNVGLAHILQGQREPAIEHLEQAVRRNPSSTRALVILAQAYGMTGRMDDCIMLLEDLLHLDPHSPATSNYRNILGMCHYQCDRFDEAIKWSKSAIASHPGATGAYLSLIAAQAEAGDQAGAAQALAELHANAPDFRLASRLAMLRPFTEPAMVDRLERALASAGLSH